MKISIGLLLLFGYLAFAIAAGSDDVTESTIPADDFPYINLDINLSWEHLLCKLNSLKLNHEDIGKTLDKHKELLQRIENGEFLRGLIIQHCITFHLKRKFTDEEVVVLKEAIKKGLMISKARVECEGSKCDAESSVEGMEPSFQKIDSLLNNRFEDKNYAHKMLQIAKYTVRSRVTEYVTISLSSSKIASFLTELFTVLDKGLTNDNSFYISKIVTREEVEELLIKKRVVVKEKKDPVTLMAIFTSTHAIVEDYLSIPPRNPEQIEFQNLLILSHCVLKRMIDHIPPQYKDVFVDARKLKLRSSRNILKTSIDNIFEYGEIDDASIDSTSPVTIADLQSDGTYALLRLISEKKKTWDKIQIDFLDIILGNWILEKILMSTVSREMYRPLIKIFDFIDNQPDESKVAVEAVLAIKLPIGDVKDAEKLN